MSRFIDRAVVESSRVWFDQLAERETDAFRLDGYGRIAETFGQPLLAAIIADVRARLEPMTGSAILEVGCGAGAITQGLVPGTARVVGLDFSVPMLDQARRLDAGGAIYVAGDASRLPVRSGMFDRVLCYSVFNNFPSLDFASGVVRELIRVTAPGGVVLIGQVPNAARRDDWFRDYATRFGGSTPSRLHAALAFFKHAVQRTLRAVRIALGGSPPPAIMYRYYDARFFRDLVTAMGHRCDILPAYDLLRGDPQRVHSDYRLDVRIEVST